MNRRTALAHLGSPNEAAEHGNQALASGRAGIGSLLPRVRRLDAALMGRYPNEPSAKDFHEHYRQLASA